MSLKKEKTKQTEIGEIPESWNISMLDTLIEKTDTVNMATENERSILYIDVSSIEKESLKIKSVTNYILKYAPARARKKVYEGDVIFATVRPTLLRVAYIYKKYDNQVCSTAFCVLRNKKINIDNRFLFYLVQRESFIEQLKSIQSGANYPSVTDKHIKLQLVPHPPLSEQKKIATILSKIQKNIELKDDLIKLTKELKKSSMKHLFTYGTEKEKTKQTEIGEIPESWKVVQLKNELQLFYGKSLPRTKRVKDEIPVYGSNGIVDYHNKSSVQGPVIIVGRKGSLGKVHYSKKNCWPIDTTYYVSIKESHILFVFHLLNSLNLDQFNSHSTIPGLSREQVYEIKTPFPPLTEQKKIATVLSKIDERIKNYEAQKATLQALFKSMLKKLMTGEIRVHKLNIETSELET